jgi:hypothetical protein
MSAFFSNNSLAICFLACFNSFLTALQLAALLLDRSLCVSFSSASVSRISFKASYLAFYYYALVLSSSRLTCIDSALLAVTCSYLESSSWIFRKS